MRVLIIEDEPWIARQLARLVQELIPEVSLLPLIGSVKEAIDFLKVNPHPDLILSDIQLSDGISFEIWNFLSNPIPIIFITAFDEYAIKAFDFFSVDYLLKPVSKENLERAINKVEIIKQKYTNHDFNIRLQQIVQKNLPIPQYIDHIWTTHIHKVILVRMMDIACLYKEDLIFVFQPELCIRT